MSWFTKSQPIFKTYYTLVDPEQYYEWEYEGFVPSSVNFYYGNVRGLRTIDKTIVAITSNIKKDVLPFSEIEFVSGKTKSKEDILSEYQRDKDAYQSELDLFKQSILNRNYFTKMQNKKHCLYGVDKWDDRAVTVNNFGSWNDILAKAQAKQTSLTNFPKPDYYKAHNLEPLRKLTETLLITNYRIPLDKQKLDLILRSGHIKPISQSQLPWNELYHTINKQAEKRFHRIQKLNNLKWIQAGKN